MGTKYVGLFGLKGHGKTSVANALVKMEQAIRVSFATPFKHILSQLFNVSLTQLETWKADENFIPHGWNMNVRRAFQHVGTECGRAICPTVWTDMLFREYDRASCLRDKHEYVAIDDVRFEDEVKAIRDKGGFVAVVINPRLTLGDDPHPSESYMRDVTQIVYQGNRIPDSLSGLFDYVFTNYTSTVDGVYPNVLSTLLPAIQQHFKFH